MKTLEEIKSEYIHYVLKECNGNKTKAAKILGISVRTLFTYVEKEKTKRDMPEVNPNIFPTNEERLRYLDKRTR